MCGIIGYTGNRDCVQIIQSGLGRLAYRGYDSAGIAVCSNGDIDLRRSHGKLENLIARLTREPLRGHTGIGHTRWATHGRPSESNAHPHRYGKFAIVHNGIIENFLELRQELIARGHEFSSETDTEIVAHLISEYYTPDTGFAGAVRAALRRVRGSYAIVAICADFPDEIVAARLQSPLLIALGDGENFAASDIAAVLAHSRRIIFLEDGDIAHIKADTVEIQDITGQPVQRPVKTVQWDISAAEKQGYPHYMLKEIFEQPQKITDTFRGRILEDEGQINLDEKTANLEFEKCSRIQIVACGTSYHAGLLGKYIIEKLARIPVDVDVASEYRYRNPIITPQDGFIAISQSGETADTYACLKIARERGSKILSICNVMDSTIPRASDATFYTRADPEIGVASTKAFTTQLASLMLLAIHFARRRQTITAGDARQLLNALRSVPHHMETILETSDSVRSVAQKLLRASSFLYLGRNVHYPIALEGALKLKEISYIHAEAYPSGEMKHGPIALIDEKLPVVVIAPKNATYEKTLSNLQEVKARGGRIISIVSEGDDMLPRVSEHAFVIPDCEEIVQPFLSVLYLQLLAYHIADLLGNDVDQPRNLAKSVTVE
ncbi:MAG: glutamine--fructose-6-phosphate transaminase (isomerizing) [Proteobacteria bacterium]|nr:glutamine--fructose-6-phosphate transaminase (isomerizing) [Pseudomonadota bacterium]